MTEKQKLFCIEYLKDFNGAKAYSRTYSNVTKDTAKANAARLLAKDDIAQYLSEEKEKLFRRVEIQAEDVIRDLIAVKNACMKPVAITAWNTESHSMEPTGETKMADSKGANQALELLGKYLGMFKDQNGVQVNSQVVIVDDIPREGSTDGKID